MMPVLTGWIKPSVPVIHGGECSETRSAESEDTVRQGVPVRLRKV